jgi:hypothetical protein
MLITNGRPANVRPRSTPSPSQVAVRLINLKNYKIGGTSEKFYNIQCFYLRPDL